MSYMKLRRVFLGILFALVPLQQASAGFIVDVYEGIVTGSDTSIAIAAMIADGTPDASGDFDLINFSGTGTSLGNFRDDALFPGSPDDKFGVHVSGSILTGAGTNYFGVNHDDGARLVIDGIQVLDRPGPTAARNTFGSIDLTAGLHTVDLWLYEDFGGVSLEFFQSDANRGVGALVTAAVPEPTTLLLLGLGLAGLGFARNRLH